MLRRSLHIAARGRALSTARPTARPAPSDLFSLHGRAALVTGGSKGLGKAIARGLALAGADVCITSRNEGELQQALADIVSDTSVRGEYIVTDLSEPARAEALGAEVLRRFGGRCDIFVNNAGVSNPGRVHTGLDEQIPPMTSASWAESLNTNLSAGVAILNSLAPSMVERGWGRVVHISSVGGRAAPGALPQSAPSTRCPADPGHHVWGRWEGSARVRGARRTLRPRPRCSAWRTRRRSSSGHTA